MTFGVNSRTIARSKTARVGLWVSKKPNNNMLGIENALEILVVFFSILTISGVIVNLSPLVSETSTGLQSRQVRPRVYRTRDATSLLTLYSNLPSA